VFAGVDAEVFNAALYGYLGSLPASPADVLAPVTRHEREQAWVIRDILRGRLAADSRGSAPR
jgi:hypothetical protein